MTDWQLLRLGDALSVSHGFAFKGEFFCDDGDLIVLTPGNFRDEGGFKPKGGKEKFYEGPFPERFLLKKSQVVVAMTEQSKGLLGSSATIPTNDKYLHNQRIGLLNITGPCRLDLRFAYHLLNAPFVRQQIQATATGSKVRHTAPNRIEAIVAPVPDIECQRRIARALDDVDNLVENNRRRIEVLEEMARLLYREWFVYFRFPGHEDVGLVASDLGPIPEGWEACRLGDVLELAYGKALRADERMGGPVGVYGSGGHVGWHDKVLVAGPGIVVGRKGNVGSVYWSDHDFFPIDTTFYVKSDLPLRFLDQLLRTEEFIDSHAAVPGLSRDQAYGLIVAKPEERLLFKYESVVQPIYSLRRNLTEQNEVLKKARDLLLPRLVSGELDVSELDLGLEALGA